VGATQDEFRQHRYWPACTAFGTARFPGGASDIQVGPVHALGELAEETSGSDGATITTADVREIGEIALQLLFVFISQR
jgi:hypothetical protein